MPAQRFDQRRKRPVTQFAIKVALDVVQLTLAKSQRIHHPMQRGLIRAQLELLIPEPRLLRLRPIYFPRPMPFTAKKKAADRLTQFSLRTQAHQFSDRLVLRIRNPNRRQIARVATIGLDPIARPLRRGSPIDEDRAETQSRQARLRRRNASRRRTPFAKSAIFCLLDSAHCASRRDQGR